ncbi:MAG: hypothetical protein EOO60_00035 [Hymenobacter sp.]|jgi:integrase|nr:MAG: hypothetical protein EOO60_00035 [Hymenobacter sp.]
MSKRESCVDRNKTSVRNWPFELPPLNREFTLSPLEKTALTFGEAQGYWQREPQVPQKVIKQPLNRFVQPIEAALRHWGIMKGMESNRRACISLLLHEMHQRQTSLWAWDETVWMEIAGNTYEEFKSTHHAFEYAHHISIYHYRPYVLACAYLLAEIPIYQLVNDNNVLGSAQRIFGGVAVEKALQILTTESVRIGRGVSRMVSQAMCSALLANRSPEVKNLTLPVLEKLHDTYSYPKILKSSYISLSELLHSLRVVFTCLPTPYKGRKNAIAIDDTLSPDWAKLILTWYANTTAGEKERRQMKSLVAKAARWATANYPDAASPQQWTRKMAIAYGPAVTKMKVGQWLHPKSKPTPEWGKPLKANSQICMLGALRLFFRECIEWEWLSFPFDLNAALATPNSVWRKRMPKPRPIESAEWTKLEEAGWALSQEDLPISNAAMVKRHNATPCSRYPLAMMRAMANVWLHTGLRSDEIRRLQVGCIRPALGEENEGNSSSPPAICLLTVPVGKSGSGSIKPVPGAVGEVIKIWEKSRPAVRKHWDYKTADAVNFLFVWKGKQVGLDCLNNTIIPILCRKAGISKDDTLGKFTSHRARHTLAFLLSNAPTPMSDADLQAWLGQLSPDSLRWYLAINIRKLEEAYAAANRVSVDTRQLEQLKKPIANGGKLPAEGKSKPSVDLGHGFCNYPFFDECSQRRPCTNCSFYKPKVSIYSELQEARSQLQRMLHPLPLSQEVRQAIEDAIAANETLVAIMRRNQEDDSSKSEGSAAADIEGT